MIMLYLGFLFLPTLAIISAIENPLSVVLYGFCLPVFVSYPSICKSEWKIGFWRFENFLLLHPSENFKV